MKVAIVSFEFDGLTKNGGIGTAFRRLAELLASNGHKVTLIFVPLGWDQRFSERKRAAGLEIARLKKRGIEVVLPRHCYKAIVPQSLFYHLARALSVHEYLLTQNFDVVHSSDCFGLTYFSLLAKRAGLEFLNSQFVIGAHGSLLWTGLANKDFAADAVPLSLLDRSCIEMADYLISPSDYMIEYLKGINWTLPRRTKVIPNVNCLGPDQPAVRNRKQGSAQNIIFFGRMESRKGIHLFIEALQKLLATEPSLGSKQRLEIVFLGRDIFLESQMLSSRDWVASKLGHFKSRIELKFFPHLTSEASHKFLSTRPNDLVCMPSLIDNSPYVIVEAMELGLNFLATKSGGQAELIHPQDRRGALCEPSVDILFKAIRSRLFNLPFRARPSALAQRANKDWVKFHKKLHSQKKIRPRVVKGAPLVSIVLGRHQGADSNGNMKSLFSVLLQSYKNIEICIPEDHRLFSADLAKCMKVTFFKAGGNLASAYQVVARSAGGKYILFLDGADLAEPGTLQQWVRAAEAWTTRNPLTIAITGIINVRKGSRDPKNNFYVFPTPQDPLLTMAGEQPANRYSLWDRKKLAQLLRKKNVDVSRKKSLASFCSYLVTKGYAFAIHPKTVIKQLPIEFLDFEEYSPLSGLEPFVAGGPRDWERLLYFVVGMKRDLYRTEIQSLKGTKALKTWAIES